MTDAIDAIHQDHLNLDKVLSVLESVVDALDRGPGGGRPGAALDLLTSVIYYVRVFPDRFHHPKEEEYLFKALARRCPEAAGVIARLQAQHKEGETLIEALNGAVKAWENDPEGGIAALRDTAHAYVRFQRQHMGLEEREVLPLARRHLGQDDWQVLNRVFRQASDPLFGENLETGFRSLFQRITRAGPRAGQG